MILFFLFFGYFHPEIVFIMFFGETHPVYIGYNKITGRTYFAFSTRIKRDLEIQGKKSSRCIAHANMEISVLLYEKQSSVSAEISVCSAQMLFIFIIQKIVSGSKHPKKLCIYVVYVNIILNTEALVLGTKYQNTNH